VSDLSILLERTPYLAGGFATNLLIATLSMALGTAIGAFMGTLRARGGFLRAPARFATDLCRNVPSFVLMFYMAFMLPSEITLGGMIYTVPLWVKATLALTFPVIGFASDQFLGYLRQRGEDPSAAGEVFAVAWIQYFLIIIMASATASVIGADEIVGRANIVIAGGTGPTFLLVTYCYVSLWFIATGLTVSALGRKLARRDLVNNR
jgi:ABC-type amino acid transport system permease subunit